MRGRIAAPQRIPARPDMRSRGLALRRSCQLRLLRACPALAFCLQAWLRVPGQGTPQARPLHACSAAAERMVLARPGVEHKLPRSVHPADRAPGLRDSKPWSHGASKTKHGLYSLSPYRPKTTFFVLHTVHMHVTQCC